MCTLRNTSTALSAPDHKLRDWNRAVSSAISPATAVPRNGHRFNAQLQVFDLGQTRFARITSGPCQVCHTPQQATGRFMFAQVAAGAVTLTLADGSVTQARKDDFWLYDLSMGGSLSIDTGATLLTMTMPRSGLLRHIAYPEAICQQLLPARTAAGNLAAGFISMLWSGADGDMPGETLQRYADYPLQLIAATYAQIPQAPQVRSATLQRHRQLIRAYVESHLCEPTLTSGVVADALGLTRRHVHRAFSEQGESVVHYIHRRRLEEVYRVLASGDVDGRSITAIAFDHGFNSLPHFSRVFRQRYGMSARELYWQSPRPGLSSTGAVRCG